MNSLEAKTVFLNATQTVQSFPYIGFSKKIADNWAWVSFSRLEIPNVFPNVYDGKNTYSITDLNTAATTTYTLDTGFYTVDDLISLLSLNGIVLSEKILGTTQQKKLNAKANMLTYVAGCVLNTGTLGKLFGTENNTNYTLGAVDITFPNHYSFVSENLTIYASFMPDNMLVSDSADIGSSIMASVPITAAYGDPIFYENSLTENSSLISGRLLNPMSLRLSHPGIPLNYGLHYTLAFTIQVVDNPELIEKKNAMVTMGL